MYRGIGTEAMLHSLAKLARRKPVPSCQINGHLILLGRIRRGGKTITPVSGSFPFGWALGRETYLVEHKKRDTSDEIGLVVSITCSIRT